MAGVLKKVIGFLFCFGLMLFVLPTLYVVHGSQYNFTDKEDYQVIPIPCGQKLTEVSTFADGTFKIFYTPIKENEKPDALSMSFTMFGKEKKLYLVSFECM